MESKRERWAGPRLRMRRSRPRPTDKIIPPCTYQLKMCLTCMETDVLTFNGLKVLKEKYEDSWKMNEDLSRVLRTQIWLNIKMNYLDSLHFQHKRAIDDRKGSTILVRYRALFVIL